MKISEKLTEKQTVVIYFPKTRVLIFRHPSLKTSAGSTPDFNAGNAE